MEQDGFDVLLAGEVEQYVQHLKPSRIEDLGTERWFQGHEYMQKLSQQAILEASELREEVVKEMIVTHNKISVLVYEAICVSVWREKVLPILMKRDEKIDATFLIYMIMFHESTSVIFLETILYHPDSCEALADSAVDLLDYSFKAVIRLLAGLKHSGDSSDIHSEDKTSQEILSSQEAIIAFNVGMRCVSILRYFAEFLDNLPLAVTSRVYGEQDLPLLIIQLLEQKPWQRKNPKDHSKLQAHIDGQWTDIPDEDRLKVTQTEGQVWIALRQLLLSPQCGTHYHLESHRRSQLSRVRNCPSELPDSAIPKILTVVISETNKDNQAQRYLTDVLLDQMSPLVDLKLFLCHLDMNTEPSGSRPPVIVEIIPEIRQSILNSWDKKWKKLAKKHAQILFQADQDRFTRLAKGLSKTYDLNVLERLSCGAPKCSACGDLAAKKCSRCKTEWYCGRECQVNSWPKHKQACNVLASVINPEETEDTK